MDSEGKRDSVGSRGSSKKERKSEGESQPRETDKSEGKRDSFGSAGSSRKQGKSESEPQPRENDKSEGKRDSWGSGGSSKREGKSGSEPQPFETDQFENKRDSWGSKGSSKKEGKSENGPQPRENAQSEGKRDSWGSGGSSKKERKSENGPQPFETDNFEDKRNSWGSGGSSRKERKSENEPQPRETDNLPDGYQRIQTPPRTSLAESDKAGSKKPAEQDQAWKNDIRVAIRESQVLFAEKAGQNQNVVDPNKYYRLIVKVPRVTKSYYDQMQDGGLDWTTGPQRNSLSENDLKQKKAPPSKNAKPHKPSTPQERRPAYRKPLGPNVTPTKATVNLAKPWQDDPNVITVVPQQRGPKVTYGGPEDTDTLSYFDPTMLQPEYRQLLEKSRNVIVGPPAEILRKYFGFTDAEDIPEQLANDPSPKAFILPKHLWKPEDDIQPQRGTQFETKHSFFGVGHKRKSKKKRHTTTEDVINTEAEQKLHKELEEKQAHKNPMEFILKGLNETGPDGRPLKNTDPKAYERQRTKCERRKRRLSSFDEDVRKTKSEYVIICGSDPSSDSNLELEPLNPEPKKRSLKRNERSSMPLFPDREGSDLSIDLGPDPMKRIPRESNIPYYKSYPMYPTISNERFYEWYKDIQKLKDPMAEKKRLRPAGESKSIAEMGPSRLSMGTRKSEEPRRESRRESRPKRLRTESQSYKMDKPDKPEDMKDYVFQNARSTVIMPPKKPCPRYVDDRHGTVHLLEPSGLLAKFVHKDEFGQIPPYLMCLNDCMGRPTIPDFNKFYQFHRCKYVYGHIHCKFCRRPHPFARFGKGEGDAHGGEKCTCCQCESCDGNCDCCKCCWPVEPGDECEESKSSNKSPKKSPSTRPRPVTTQTPVSRLNEGEKTTGTTMEGGYIKPPKDSSRSAQTQYPTFPDYLPGKMGSKSSKSLKGKSKSKDLNNNKSGASLSNGNGPDQALNQKESQSQGQCEDQNMLSQCDGDELNRKSSGSISCPDFDPCQCPSEPVCFDPCYCPEELECPAYYSYVESVVKKMSKLVCDYDQEQELLSRMRVWNDYYRNEDVRTRHQNYCAFSPTRTTDNYADTSSLTSLSTPVQFR